MTVRFGWVAALAVAGTLLVGCGKAPVSSMAQVAPSAMQARQADVLSTIVFTPSRGLGGVSVVEVLGIDQTYRAALVNAGIRNGQQLLAAGSTRTGRSRLSKATGISDKLILRWVNHCDLMRIIQVGPEFSRLLELAGVDTVAELAQRNPVALVSQIKDANALGGNKVAVHRLPGETLTTRWVNDARSKTRMVEY